jgi:hypothetical protein
MFSFASCARRALSSGCAPCSPSRRRKILCVRCSDRRKATCLSMAGFLTSPTPRSCDLVWRIAKEAQFIASAGLRSRAHRSARTLNTLDVSSLLFPLTAQEGRLCSKPVLSTRCSLRPVIKSYGADAYVYLNYQTSILEALVLTTKPAELRSFYFGANTLLPASGSGPT